MMKEAVALEMNSQINRELFSAYLYLSMAAWFEGKGLSGFSNWMRVQAQEERDHAMGFFNHMLERGASVSLEAIAKPEVEWTSPLAAFEAVLTHERFITASIDHLLETAQTERDHAAANFIQWYVAEQAEEEANKIKIHLALEPELTGKLAESRDSLEARQLDIARIRAEMESLAYSQKIHELAKLALAEAERNLAASQKDLSDKRIRLGVLEAELERLKEEEKRKKEHQMRLEETSRKLEVVEMTRGLVNDFMDQVLIRVKNDIAKAASEILEEVSGKYSLLKIDDDFNIQVEDGGNYYPISRYSGGEIDMIAVSVRVAISEYLMRFGPDGESYSFLILDEVFGSQDIEHREKMIQMLRSLEERFPQIIAISHISDVQGQFDNTLLVVEDELGNSRVEAI